MRNPAFLALFALGAAVARPACAQTMSQADFLSALKQRDDAIAVLEKRVAALEAERTSPPPAGAIATLDAPKTSASAATASDDDVLQALSRGLVEQGAILLPPWTAEVTPGLSYSHSIKQGLVLVDTPQGISTVTDQRLRDDAGQATLTARVGLPWNSQIQLSAPFGWTGETSSLGDGSQTSTASLGVGDVAVELSHQFLAEGPWKPSLVGALGWRFPTGADPYRSAASAGVSNGGGVHQGVVRVTALKSYDPMVFFATFSYAHSLPITESYGRVAPGDEFDLQLGGALSVSPATSLSLSFRQDFRAPTRVDKVAIAGSDQVPAIVQFGVDQVLTRRMLLDVSVGVGVTRDAPNYTFLVSLPIRLN